MNQYEFQVTSKRTKAKDQVRATAHSEIEAYKAICAYYFDYEIATHASSIRPPHAVVGEISCV